MRRSDTDAITHLVESEQLTAIHYGRQAAALIRQHFPDFYAAQVADLRTTPAHLLGVVQAFFSLAQTLTNRLNAALDLDSIAVPAMATAALLGDLQPGYQTIGILVGAVDTASGRRAMHEALIRSRWQLWLDVGNERDWGTVLLGTATDPRDLHGAMALGGICTALPAPSLRHPHLLDDAPMQVRADCAHAAVDGAQSLIVNQAMAAVASHYVYQLVMARQITTCETALDLATLTMRSTTITATSLAEASGLTVADVTTLPETTTKRKGERS